MSYNSDLQNQRRDWALDYLGNACVLCDSKEKLEFDHIIPETKQFNITSYLKGNLDKLKLELDKCQLLCNNCHTEKTKKESYNKITHGKQWAAIHLHCKCENCLVFRDEYNAKRRELRTGTRIKMSRVHGTYAMYKAKCRCSECKKANSLYMKAFKQKKKSGSEGVTGGTSA